MNNEGTGGLTQKLNKEDRRNAAWHWSFTGSNSINYGTPQRTGYAWFTAKALHKIYPNDDDYVEAMRVEHEYFSITPYMEPLVTGANVALREQQGTEPLGTVRLIKTSLMGSLSGTGDSLLWVLYPTIMGSIGGYIALESDPLGTIIWITSNPGLVWMRLKLFDLGYESGIRLITDMADKLNTITESASVMELTVMGSSVAAVIRVCTPIEPTFDEVTMGLQTGVFDRILLALLSVLLTALAYFLMERKKWGFLKVIFLLLAFSLLGTYFGFLGVTP